MQTNSNFKHMIKNEIEYDLPTAIAEKIAELVDDGTTLAIPSRTVVNEYMFAQDRRIWLDYEVDNNAVELVKQIMLWNMEDSKIPRENRKPIWIYMINYGGAMDYGIALIDAIKASETPVYTVNVGMCGSAAALIFIAGERRFMMKNATVVIHEGSADVSGDAVKVQNFSDQYKTKLKKMREFVLENTNIPSAMLNKKKNDDWYIDTDTCVKYNICTDVIEKLSDVIGDTTPGVVGEIEEYKDTIYNLRGYLTEAMNMNEDIKDHLENKYEGLPGYTPVVLK